MKSTASNNAAPKTETSAEKKQFNFRLAGNMRKQIGVLAAEVDYPMNDIGDDLVRFVLGSKDKALVQRLNQLAELARRKGYDKTLPPEEANKMERAKGFEPSTFTLARLGSGIKVSIRSALAYTKGNSHATIPTTVGRKVSALHGPNQNSLNKIRNQSNQPALEDWTARNQHSE